MVCSDTTADTSSFVNVFSPRLEVVAYDGEVALDIFLLKAVDKLFKVLYSGVGHTALLLRVWYSGSGKGIGCALYVVYSFYICGVCLIRQDSLTQGGSVTPLAVKLCLEYLSLCIIACIKRLADV